MLVTEQAALSFGGLLRQLRAEARLTQEELAEAARLSPRAVSALERGVNRTARKDTAELLAGALGLAGPARELFVAAARGKAPPGQVLAAVRAAQPQPQGAVTASPYRGLAAFEEQHAAFFFGRDTAAAEVLDRMSRRLDGAGLLVVSGFRARGSRRCCGRGCCRGSARAGWRPRRKRRRGRAWCSPRPGIRSMN